MDAWLHEKYAAVKKRFQRLDYSGIYFSPSSANSDKRELYVKALKMKRDDEQVKPWRRRWTAQGTALGDWLQREILLAERHYEKYTGEAPRFKMARTELGEPFFEDFVKTQKFIEHNGKTFSLLGTCDGVMEYVDDNGEVLRVGLEIKSKQTTAAQTSDYSMREAKEDHIKQVVCYSIMYGTAEKPVDYYLIVYVNASKKSWNMTDEEYAKSPDVRVFGVEITQEMKNAVLDDFADVVNAVETRIPPPMNLDKFLFNNFKTACSLDLSDGEFDELKSQVRAVMKSGMPNWKKQSYFDALEFIKEVRTNASA